MTASPTTTGDPEKPQPGVEFLHQVVSPEFLTGRGVMGDEHCPGTEGEQPAVVERRGGAGPGAGNHIAEAGVDLRLPDWLACDGVKTADDLVISLLFLREQSTLHARERTPGRTNFHPPQFAWGRLGPVGGAGCPGDPAVESGTTESGPVGRANGERDGCGGRTGIG